MTAETSNARGEWVLVPREPSESMLSALTHAVNASCNRAEWYAHMLAAAPPPAAARGDVRGLVDKLVDAAYQDGMQELDAMSNETLSARSALEQALAQQPAAGAVDDAMHWIDRYAAGIDSECQIDRIIDAVAADAARDAERYRWLRRALLGAEDDPIDRLLLEKEPETEAEFDAAVDAALATQHQEPTT